jgi:Flp pilus assembly protein CpaB
MEMEFKDTARRRRVLMIVIGVVLAAAAGWGAFMLASGNKSAAPVITEPVLVAARDIPARQAVTADDVTVRQVPIDEVLTQSYKESNLVIGRLTAVPVYTDQQMTPNLFATSTADADFSILGPDEEVSLDSPYWRAVSVEVPANRAVGGEISAGQHVDLIVSVEIQVLGLDPEGNYVNIDTATQEGLQSGKSTKITFQDIEVLKADAAEGMYVLKVDLHQAEQIAHVIQLAPDSFAMVLRPDTDTRPANTVEYGVTTDRLIMQYLFPVPQLMDLSLLLGQPVTPTAPNPTPTPDPNATLDPNATPDPNASPAPDASAAPEESPAASPAP